MTNTIFSPFCQSNATISAKFGLGFGIRLAARLISPLWLLEEFLWNGEGWGSSANNHILILAASGNSVAEFWPRGHVCNCFVEVGWPNARNFHCRFQGVRTFEAKFGGAVWQRFFAVDILRSHWHQADATAACFRRLQSDARFRGRCLRFAAEWMWGVWLCPWR